MMFSFRIKILPAELSEFCALSFQRGSEEPSSSVPLTEDLVIKKRGIAMKWMLMVVLLWISGCSAGVTEQRIRQDFLEIIGDKYQYISVENLQKVAFGDGWDDGVEVRVYFDAKCKSSTPPPSAKNACRDGPMQMQLSYKRNADGNWIVLSSEVVSP